MDKQSEFLSWKTRVDNYHLIIFETSLPRVDDSLSLIFSHVLLPLTAYNLTLSPLNAWNRLQKNLLSFSKTAAVVKYLWGICFTPSLSSVQIFPPNRPLPSSKNPHFQNEARCTTFLVKMSFICMRMKNDFHIKGWPPTLVLNRGPVELGNGLLRMVLYCQQLL